MAIKQELGILFNKEMDRGQFLKHIAVGAIAVTGATAIIKAINGVNNTMTPAKPTVTRRGYGNSGYGSKTEVS
jgi:hypothetical protein